MSLGKSVLSIKNETGDVKKFLHDRGRTSRERPWREKRRATLRISRALRPIDPEKAARYSRCGEHLVFEECSGPDGANHPKRLKHGNFCRQRLCPMCMWQRTVKLGRQIAAMLHEVLRRNPGWSLIMLTLTQKNVSGDQLAGGVDKILKGWKRLSNRMFPDSVMGWSRTLEVTHNERDGSWHPHIHALLVVRSDYWERGTYITQRKWCEMWAHALGVSYTPIVDVHRVKARGRRNTLNAVVQEISKYTVKEMDILKGDDSEIRERIQVLERALRGRRLIAFGGVLKELAQVIKNMPRDEESSDTCPVCGSPLRKRFYPWDYSVGDYVADDAYLADLDNLRRARDGPDS